MQRGATFVLGSNLAQLYRDEDGVTLHIDPFAQRFDHHATELHDITWCPRARADDPDDPDREGGDLARYAALYTTGSGEPMLVEAVRERGVQVTMLREAPAGARRVAMTYGRWYVAGDAEVHVLRERTGRFRLLSLDAVDLAASHVLVCIADDRGVTWFDRGDQVVARRALGSPTAIAYDGRIDGWLVATDGDVLQLASPDAPPVVLARGIGLASRIRRDLDAVYGLVGDELREVVGVRHGPTTNAPATIARRPTDFVDFDTRFELQILTAEGWRPQRFYRDVPCRCRVRTVETLESWSERRPDNSYDHHERHRCPQCGREWDENYGP